MADIRAPILEASRCYWLGALLAAALVVALAGSPTGAASPHPLKAWCSLHPGASRAAVVKALGKPHGSKALPVVSQLGVARSAWAEWDVSGDVLLVTFEGPHGTVSNLQAYGSGLPFAARNLSCKTFRHANGLTSDRR